MKASFLPVTGILLAAGLATAACGSAASVTAAPASAAPSTALDSPSDPVTSAPAPSASATSATASPASSPATASPSASAPGGSATAPSAKSGEFSKALTAWKAAAASPVATMNTYLQQAASDLKAAGNPAYSTAISELTYLASLPATDLTSAQVAQAQSDEKDLDKFFGTPGLME